jgi:hypothetical protein
MEICSYEIVVARYKENINWLFNVNKKWKITIYNKGPKFDNLGTIKIRNQNITIIDIENKGREADTIAYHMLNRYDNYADLTVFIQADPFTHSPEMKELLEVLANKTTMDPETEKYIPMTTCYDITKNVPPPVISALRQNRFFRIEKMSPYTLDCLDFTDYGVHNIANAYRKQYNKPLTVNIIDDVLQQLDIPNNSSKELIQFHFAACFALPSYTLMQYNKEFYERLYKVTNNKEIMPWIMERCWLTIFDPEFDSSKILPEYSLPGSK